MRTPLRPVLARDFDTPDEITKVVRRLDLGPVPGSGGHQCLTAGLAVTRSPMSLVADNGAAIGALNGSGPTMAVSPVAWMKDHVSPAARPSARTRGSHV